MSFVRVAFIACVFCSTSAVQAAVDDTAPPLGQTVRLAHQALGCGSFESLQRVARGALEQDEVTLGELSAEGCRPFRTFHGEVVHSKGGMVCILGIGDTRCLWFPANMTEPARRLP